MLEWRPSTEFQILGGLMIVPFCRDGLQSTGSDLTLDASPMSTIAGTATQSSASRDVGFAAKGFFHHDRLLYGIGEFGGERDANGRNSP